jgi:hypothetical protein
MGQSLFFVRLNLIVLLKQFNFILTFFHSLKETRKHLLKLY